MEELTILKIHARLEERQIVVDERSVRQPLFFISSQTVYYELSQRLSFTQRLGTVLSEGRVTTGVQML